MGCGLALALLLSGCDSSVESVKAAEAVSAPNSQVTLNSILESGKLRLLTRNAPTTYYVGRLGPSGFEYDLAVEFAADLGVTLELHLLDSVEDILLALERGEGDLAAAGLTGLKSRSDRFLLGPDYFDVEQQLVCRRGKGEPRRLEDVVGRRLHIIAASSYGERLQELKTSRVPELSWEEQGDVGTEELLHMVSEGKIDCTVSDSSIVRINRRYLPQLSVVETLSSKQQLNWIMPRQAAELDQSVTSWFARFKAAGKLQALESYYFDYIPSHDFVDLRAFHRRIDKRLPPLRPLFEESGQRHDIPWRFLAAQAYQESHWDPKAKSPTGVRGIMMLTQGTAKSVGVTNRLDPAQSIEGGARYLKKLINRVPESVTSQQQRIQMALAAYNVGMGHLYDARTLARRLGKNPDVWSDLRVVFPLLSQKKYYTTLKYGYARGREPVSYVDKVRHYYNILDERLNRDVTEIN